MTTQVHLQTYGNFGRTVTGIHIFFCDEKYSSAAKYAEQHKICHELQIPKKMKKASLWYRDGHSLFLVSLLGNISFVPTGFSNLTFSQSSLEPKFMSFSLDFSEDVVCIFRYHSSLQPQSPFSSRAAASVHKTRASCQKKDQLRFFIKQSSLLGKCKVAYAEQVRSFFSSWSINAWATSQTFLFQRFTPKICKETGSLDFRVNGKVIEDTDTPNSLGLKSGNVIDVFSDQAPYKIKKVCSKPFRVIILNEIGTKETSSTKSTTITTSRSRSRSRRGRPVGSKTKKREEIRATSFPFRVLMVQEVGWKNDWKK